MLPLALSSLGSMFGGSAGGSLLGGGEKSDTASMPATSGISGATSFSTGGLTVNKADSTVMIVIAAVAGLIVFAALRKH